jgi:hypothetical protein
MYWIFSTYHDNTRDYNNTRKNEKKYHSYFTKSPLSFALTIKNIYTFFFYPSSRKQMVRADTSQAKKRLKPTRVRGAVGPIKNPARIARLEEGV